MASNWQQTYEQLKKRKKQVDNVKSTSEIKQIDQSYNSVGSLPLLSNQIAPNRNVSNITSTILGTNTFVAPTVTNNKASELAPVKTTETKKVEPTVKSKDELLKRRDELKEQLINYDREQKNKWWNKDDNILENAGNVLYKLFAEKEEDKYVKDDKYDALVKEYQAIEKQLEDDYVANKKYSDGFMGVVDKTNETIAGNFMTGVKGIESTASKILGQTPNSELTLEEKLSQKARQETDGIAGVGLDVLGSVSRMLPQMAVGNPTGATIMGFANYGGGAYNEAKRDGYTEEQATKYGVAIGTMEMALSKALGSFGDIYGTSKLGKSTQTVIDKVIPKVISNPEVRTVISQFGSEGIEEFIQEYASNIAKDTLLDEKGFLKSTWENVTDTDVLSDALYSAFVGGITGATMATPGAVDSYRNRKATGNNGVENNNISTEQVNEEIAPVNEQVQQQVNPQETVEDIDNQIAVLEEQLMATENDVEYERLSNQIKELEIKAEQIENGIAQPTIAPVQENAQNIENNVQNNETTPVQMANVEQTNQPTAQQTKSNSLVDVESNTQEITESPVLEEKSPDKTGNVVQVANDTKNIENKNNREAINNLNNIDGYIVQEEIMPYDEVVGHTFEVKTKEGKAVLGIRETNDTVYLTNIVTRQGNNAEKGAGTKILNNLKEYADKTGKKLILAGEVSSAKGFYDKFSWLKAEKGAIYDDNGNLFDDNSPNRVYDPNEQKKDEKISKRTTPTQEELDNLEYTRKNKSGSEYASEYYALGKKYGTTNLYKALNNYKSTGQAIEEIAPVKQELSDLTNDLKGTIKDTKKELKALTKELNEVKSSVSEVQAEFKALTEADLPMIEQQATENLRSITENDIAPVKENTTPEYEFENDNEGTQSIVESPLEDRTLEEVGSRKVKAYQYENPEVRPYFQEAAQQMLGDLHNSQKGERYVIGDISQTGNGNYEYSGQTRQTTSDIAALLDSKYNYTYADIEKGLNAIIEDHGAENIAIAKRIEFALDERLRNGYTNIDGYNIPANEGYINLLRAKEFGDYHNSLPTPEETGEIAPININIPTGENVAKNSSKKLYEAIESMPETMDNGGKMIRVSPTMEKKTLNKENNNKKIDWEALEDTSKGEQQNLKVKKLGETLKSNNTDWETVESTSKGNQQQFNTETEQIEDSIEKKTKKQIKQELLEKTGILNENLDYANKLPKLLMENTDPIRLQEMIFGRKLGNKINDMFFQKVKDNTSEKIRFQNKERAEIKELGIKAKSKESAAVQKYGEKQWVNDYDEVVPYGDKELAGEFPDVETQNKIKRAAEIIRRKYDNYLETTNEVLTKLGYDAIPKREDYMRHFQELNDIFSRVGIPYNYNEMTANDLPTDINGLTADFSPSKNFFASTLQRKGVKTTYDAITGIDGYLEGVGNLIYHTEDIQRLRAYEQYIRDTYGENHGFDNLETLTDEEKIERIEKIQDNHLSNYAAWLHEYTNTLAGKKALIDRSIEGLTGRKIYSFLNTTKTQVGRNMIGFNISSAATNLIAGVQAIAKTNKLAATKGLADTVKSIFVKDNFAEKNNFLTSRFGSDRLSKTLWQKAGDAGFIFMQGTDNFISNFVVRSKYNELKAKGLSDEQAHIEAGKFASKLMSDRSQGAAPNIYNSQMLGLVTQFQNEVNNQLYSMFYDTYHESKEAAKGNAAKTAVGMTYTLGQMAVLTHLFGTAFEQLAGYNPTFDIIDMLMKAFGLDDEEDEKETTSKNVSQAFGQLINALPYVNILTGGGRIPVSEAFTGVTDSFKALTGGKDEYGQDVEWSDAWKSMKESAPYFLLPSGYGQIKKTTQGLGMYDEDLPIAGSYTDSGNLRFTAEDDTLSKIQAGIFGRWANDEAKAYVDSEFKTINKANVDELIDLGMTSSEYRKLKQNITKAGKSNEDKVNYIADLDDLTDSQKNILVNNILDRDYDVDVSNYDDYSSYEEFDFFYKNREKYDWLQQNDISYNEYSASDESKELYNYAYKNPETFELGKAITGDFKAYKEYADYIWDLKADKDEDGNSISGSKKTKVISYVNDLDLSIPQKAMLIRKTYSSFDEYNVDIVEYVSGLDIDYEKQKSILESLDMKVYDDGTVEW